MIDSDNHCYSLAPTLSRMRTQPHSARLVDSPYSVRSVPAVVARIYAAAFGLDREFRDRLVRRRREHRAGTHVEARAMTRAFDRVAVQFAGRQIAAIVRA